MKKEKECWMCRRNVEQLKKDLLYYMDTFGVPDEERDDHVLIDSMIGDQKSWICQGCQYHFWNMTHPSKDETIDDYTLVTMGDLWALQKKIANAFKDE